MCCSLAPPEDATIGLPVEAILRSSVLSRMSELAILSTSTPNATHLSTLASSKGVTMVSMPSARIASTIRRRLSQGSWVSSVFLM